MHKSRLRPAPQALVETLETRVFLSASGAGAALTARTHAAAATGTKTTLRVAPKSITFGSGVLLTATVKPAAKGAIPTGTVEFLDNGAAIQGASGAISVALDSTGRASYTFTVGDVAFYLGKHSLKAEFIDADTTLNSTSKAVSLAVALPTLTTSKDGVQKSTLQKGAKTAATLGAGQTATVIYTGFIIGSGAIFDFSDATASGANGFTYTSADVIPGFEEGTLGMKVGETRVVAIPSSLAYGGTAHGAIPANSNLAFIVKLLAVT